MRSLFLGLGVVGVLLVAFFAFNSYIYTEKQESGLPTDYRGVTFWISGEPVRLIDGEAYAITSLGGASQTTVRYFGNEIAHDIDGDGRKDMVFWITQDAGGSGTFFYVVGALQREDGYQGTHAVYIGDRIAPQSTQAGEGRQVVVTFADRAYDQPFTEPPSLGKSIHLLLDTETLEFGEVVQGFEGEVY